MVYRFCIHFCKLISYLILPNLKLTLTSKLLSLPAMKKWLRIVNCILLSALLSSIALQSIHSCEHISKVLSESHCHHDHKSAQEITHQHHGYDHCSTCDFALSSFLPPTLFAPSFFQAQPSILYLFASDSTLLSFFQNSPPLRGPPVFIV